MEVILITGYGKSGSTLLDIAMGNHGEWESLGEAINLPSVIQRDDYVARDTKFSDHAAFKSFLARSIEKYGADLIRDSLQDYDRFFNPKNTHIKPAKFWSDVEGSSLTALLGIFLAEISNATGKTQFIDSSKNPNVIHLYKSLGFNIRTIVIVRNPYAVYLSLRDGKKKSPEAGIQAEQSPKTYANVIIRWFYWYLWTYVVINRARITHTAVLYEDFCNNPQLEINRIFEALSVQPVLLPQELSVGNHIIAGNRLRLARSLSIKPLAFGQNKKFWARCNGILQRAVVRKFK